MRRGTFSQATLYACLLTVLLTVPVWAQPPGGRGIFGDWQVKIPFGEREMNVILSFTRTGPEGEWTGQWISPFGMNDLKDIKFEDNTLRFVHVARFGDNEFVSTFSGTVEENRLSGVLSNDQGESDVTGQRSPRVSPAAGRWELKYKVGDRDVTGTLVVTPDKEGRLSAKWESEFGEHEISDFSYERRALSFKRKSKMQDRQWESTFSGSIDGDTLTGTIKSEMGDIEVQGARLGAAAIGTWLLDVSTEWGDIKQRLVVNPDMSALYGTMPVKKVELADGKLTFGMVVPFGDEEFKMDFAGKISDGKLVGQMTTSRGTQEIKGTKVVRPQRPGR
ncbi:MAG TPA: hypothetical protein PLU87_18690 [Sedimentisphaerales bacterium]|nr:hypothetical protein [Sedimentisphaerales bacterium]HRS13114.1 hypothetical protein [Sedimentisphaerales bacterium]HRV49679.1 hypothetical protein [Sedimentisphaerales bacterium]